MTGVTTVAGPPAPALPSELCAAAACAPGCGDAGDGAPIRSSSTAPQPPAGADLTDGAVDPLRGACASDRLAPVACSPRGAPVAEEQAAQQAAADDDDDGDGDGLVRSGALHGALPPRRMGLFVASVGVRLRVSAHDVAMSDGRPDLPTAAVACDGRPCSDWALPVPFARALSSGRLARLCAHGASLKNDHDGHDDDATSGHDHDVDSRAVTCTVHVRFVRPWPCMAISIAYVGRPRRPAHGTIAVPRTACLFGNLAS